MSLKILDACQVGFPLSAGQTIHQQSGWPDLIVVGSSEIERLPKAQQKAVRNLEHTQRTTVSAFVSVDNGDLILNQCSMVLARVSKKGKVEKLVQLL
ncbi:MAG: hypothetical protein UU09_C0017G0002 [Microgenomates group bacterium GW2011_GWA2_40_6]|nr:MAG: hypothetical protein UU09_C0017G0002 [Microgenomates group bacterium GW2011_GWA2_40_6]HCC31988.1 hypothetical protein [Marinilabiliales bacterium]